MTSEVVVMNTLAVALAADSAATVSAGEDNKIYNSADKLFMLSKRHPVGVMVYNNAAFLGVPWESILKMFRSELGSREFPHLTDYLDHLLKFLTEHKTLFPNDIQELFYLDLVQVTFQRILNSIRDQIYGKLVQEDTELTVDAQLLIAKERILKERDAWATKADTQCYDPAIGETLVNSLSAQVSEISLQTFEDFPLDGESSSALRNLAIMLVSKADIARESLSGLVIAGFGREEHFPVVQSLELAGMYMGNLKYTRNKRLTVSATSPSLILPFAHSEMLTTFLVGVNPRLEARLRREVASLINQLPTATVQGITDLTDQQKQAWAVKMRPVSAEAAEIFLNRLNDYCREQHLAPIHQTIANFPKDQLAHVAASLVNLNSFQKRMSMKPETVGGPIDVAVVSKGDGFVWIERKHYFRPELNHHFFRNYYHDARYPTGDSE